MLQTIKNIGLVQYYKVLIIIKIITIKYKTRINNNNNNQGQHVLVLNKELLNMNTKSHEKRTVKIDASKLVWQPKDWTRRRF